MAHQHQEEGHAHHHHGLPDSQHLNRAFLGGISLNLIYVFAEFAAGLYYDSLGLLSDAGHNLSDVAGLVLALLAFRLAKLAPNKRYTYGYKKSTILVSLLNAVILLVAVGAILTESIEKLFRPQPVDGIAIAWVAAIGVGVNALTAWLFLKDKEKDLNVKGAYLHMAADALVSVGVVLSGVVIHYTGWNIIDPIIGMIIAAIIVYSTWSLLHDSFRLTLDGVPVQLDIEKIAALIASQPQVSGVHHLHIWGISTTDTALTAHIEVDSLSSMEQTRDALKALLQEAGISHATLEFETPENRCCTQGTGCDLE